MELPKKEKPTEIANEKKELLEKQKEELIEHKEQKLLSNKKVDELTNDLKRVMAEFDNYKKRSEKEKFEFARIANAEIIKQLLNVLDELEITMQHVKDKGVEMVYANLVAILKANGLVEMNDKKFDPYKHEAIKQVEGDDEGKIIETIKKGYTLNGVVLRHALVIVSKKK
ncbi:MAG: nucleotide exchange factor GrpE [Candidatus Micrarchaeota archaeon]